MCRSAGKTIEIPINLNVLQANVNSKRNVLFQRGITARDGKRNHIENFLEKLEGI